MRISVPFPRLRTPASDQPTPADRRWLALPLALTVGAGLLFWWLPARLAPITASTTAAVSQGTLTLSISGSGAVAAARSADLTFPEAVSVTAVNVKVGDQVQAGQTLAQISAADLQLQLQQAQANLKAAQAKLTQIKTGSVTPQDVASAQAALNSAKAQLDTTRSGGATKADIQSAQAQLAAAQAKLDALKNPSPANLSAAQSKLAQTQTALESTRTSASQAKTNADLQLQNAVNTLTQSQSKYSTAQQNWQYVQETGNDPVQPTKTTTAGKAVANTLNDAQQRQYYDAFVQAQASLASAQNAVTQSQVAYDAARQKEVADVQQAEAAVQDAQTTLAALSNPSPSDLTQAQAAVTQAQAALTKLTQGGTAAAIAQAQAGVAQAQANLDKLSAPATEADLATAEAGVLQAQVAAATAERSLAQASLVAPFDGVVAAVTVQPGSIAGASTAAMTIIDRSKLHIDVSLSETDAAKVQVGQPVALTFDALPDVTLKGTVATVAPAATVSQNVVTYPVQVEFDPGSAPVKVGMSATAEIQVQQIAGAILVPSRALQTSGGARVVTVLYGGARTPVTVPVETGATSNGQVVIISCVETGAQCLQPGDTLSILSTTSATPATTRNGNGGLRLPIGPGGGR